MLQQMRPAIVILLVMVLLTGLAYPLVVTGIAQTAFPRAAGGSLVVADGRVVGSQLVAQAFRSDRYFHPRPSAAGAGYDAASSGGSNLGPTSAALIKAVAERVRSIAADDRPVPVDLVTASGSGLDPHISPAAAIYQVDRVAAARGIAPVTVLGLVAEHTEGRTLGLLGEPRVNILLLNLALDRLPRAGG